MKKSNPEIKRRSINWSLLVIIFLVGTSSFFLSFLIYGNRNTVQSDIKKYPLIDASRHVILQEHYLTTLQSLREELNQLVDEFGRGNVSLYLEYLNTGGNISINPDLYLWSASLPKLPIAMAVMKNVENGVWNLDNEMVLMPVDKDDNSGSTSSPLWENPIGTRFTIETLVRELLINSDNTANNILFRNFHADDLDGVVSSLGLSELFDKEGRISAKQYSVFFRSLYTASFMNRESSQFILSLLVESTFKEYLSQGIPDNVFFSHKYGENIFQRVYADSGIVYLPNRPYILTVIIQGDETVPFAEDKQKAVNFMADVSRVSYEYIYQQ